MNIPDLRTPQRTAIVVCASIFVTVVAAFAIPPGVSGGDETTADPGGFAGGLPASVPEDLSAFVGSDRWGISLEEVFETVGVENLARRGLNPALRRIGFLGLIEAGDTTAVLLASPEPDGGSIIQLALGDTLPDGRVLTSVTDNSITLTGRPESAGVAADAKDSGDTGTDAGVHQEVLLLFPRGEPDSARRGGPGNGAKPVVDSRLGGESASPQIRRRPGSNAKYGSRSAWDEHLSDEQKLRFEQYLRQLEALEEKGQRD